MKEHNQSHLIEGKYYQELKQQPLLMRKEL